PPSNTALHSRSNQHCMARNKGTSRRSRHSASLWSLLLFVVGLSVFEYVEHGRVTWHQKLYYAVQDLRGSAQSTQPGAAPASPETSNTLSGWVARVSDGDTFTLNVSGLE